MKKKVLNLFIFIVLMIILRVLTNIDNQDEKIIYFDISGNFHPLLNCSPFIENNLATKVKIDGIEYPRLDSLVYNERINFTCLERGSSMKKILLWNSFFGLNDFGIDLGMKEPFKKMNCPITKCELTNDKTKLYNSDLVLVHMGDKISYLPNFRPRNQRWVLLLYESPYNSPNLSKFNSFFNLTSTYRIDSDFFETDGTFYWKENKDFDVDHDYLASKKEFAVALISNCETQSKRLDYIQILQKFIKVDIFGKCGRQCSEKSTKFHDCRSIIANEYKFFFAFENSICKDYVTEKLYQTLKYNIIPVVLGGADYEIYIPKSGFINVKDFSSPKQLADYLIYLSFNKTAYNSYFKWKRHITIPKNTPSYPHICNMCIRMHLETFFGIKNQIIENVEDYWRKDKCFTPKFVGNDFFIEHLN